MVRRPHPHTYVRGELTSEGNGLPLVGGNDPHVKVVPRIIFTNTTFGSSPSSVMKRRCVI